MKVSRKVILLFILIPAVAVGLGVWYYVHSTLNRSTLKEEIQRDRDIISELGYLETDLDNFLGHMQNQLVQVQLREINKGREVQLPLPLPESFRETALPSNSEVRAIFKEDPDRLDKSEAFNELQGSVNTLRQKYNEFQTNKRAGKDEKLYDNFKAAINIVNMAKSKINVIRTKKGELMPSRIETAKAEEQQFLFIVIALVGGVFILSILGIIITNSSVSKPIRMMLSRVESRQKLHASNSELGKIASHINKIQTELDATETAITQVSKGQVEFAINEEALQDRQVNLLNEFKNNFRRLNSDVNAKETELKAQKERVKKLEEGLEQTRLIYQTQIKSLQSNMAVIEYDEGGMVYNLSDALTELTGITLPEILAQGDKNDFSPNEGALAQMWSTVNGGTTWKGIIRLKSKKQESGVMLAATAAKMPSAGGESKDKVVLAGIDITKLSEEKESFATKLKKANTDLEKANQELQKSKGELEQNKTQLQSAQSELEQRQQALAEAQETLDKKNEELQNASAAVDSAVNEAEENRAELEMLQQELDKAKTEVQSAEESLQKYASEHDDIRSNYEKQKQLEFRLVQQQSAMQELTRNKDLKEGNVREAVRSVTESAAYALGTDRVGLWLFMDNGTRLRCLDLFDKSAMTHGQAPDLLEKDIELFFQHMKKEVILVPEDVKAHAATGNMVPVYLDPFKVTAIMASAVRLGGSHVGMLMVESINEPRTWSPDEQNFLVSVSDVVSLALEQGNRRAMEEELRMTLEESQALEEELRQNAEEIEATNEEMRRTQVELRGQIAALNNAAIVCETNLKGRVTYANDAFTEIYKYDQKEVLGKNLNILQSGQHNDDFWLKMWGNITQGLVYQGEICNKGKDGELIWTTVTITPVLGIDGTPFKYISVAFNITSRKLQEEQIQNALNIAVQQEELLRMSSTDMESANSEMRRTQIELAGQINALNNSSLVFETDMECNIIYVNDALLRASSFEKEDLIGNRFNVLRSGRQSEALYQNQWKSILNGKIWKGELENVRKDGEFFWAVVTSTPVLNENGEPLKTIHVLFDITEQKQQEFRLKKQQTALSKLSSHSAVKEANVDAAFEEITKVARETLGVNRTAIWMFNDSHDTLECKTISQGDEHVHGEGAQIAVELYPTYFHTLERDRIIAAYDAVGDPRTRELGPGLLEPAGITSVMDAVITIGVDVVGVLSIESKGATRNWTLDEQSFSTSIAETIGLVLEQKERMLTDKLKDAYAELELKNQDIAKQKKEIEETTTWLKESIRYAKRIQQNILPNKSFMDEYMENYFIVYRPKDVVGGDFYWFNTIGNQCVMVVADGTGHGVPGAFLTLIGYLLLNQIVLEKRVVEPAEILKLLHIGVRTALKQDDEEGSSRDGFDIAVCTFNMSTFEAEYAGANLPFYYYQDWEIHEIKPTKKSIGGEQLEEERVFQNHNIQLRQGDAIYMYTDGFVDQMGGPDDKRFTSRRFRDLILRTQHESLATQRALLNLKWKDWKEDGEQLDDVTVFGLKFS